MTVLAGIQAVRLSPPKRGQLLALAVTTSTAWVDLTAAVTVDSKSEKTFCNRYITLQADGGDVYVALTKAASGALDSTGTSSVDGTTKAPTSEGTKECVKIPSGTSVEFLMDSETTAYKYLAFIGSASCVLRVWPSSPREIKERRLPMRRRFLEARGHKGPPLFVRSGGGSVVVDIDQTSLDHRWRPSRAASCWADNGTTPASTGGTVYRVDDEIGGAHLVQATAGSRATLTANVSPAGYSGLVFASGKSMMTLVDITTTATTYYWVGLFVRGTDSIAFSRTDGTLTAVEYLYFDTASNGAGADTVLASRGTSRQIQPAADSLPTAKLGVVAVVVDAGSNVKLYVDGTLVGTAASSPGTTALVKKLALNVYTPGSSTFTGANTCLELDLYSVAHNATAVAANSAILLAKYTTLGAWTPLDLPANVLLRLHAPLALADLGATNAGAGSAVDGGDVGWVKDEKATADSRSLDPLVQASAGVRPTVSYHAKGKGVAIRGSGQAGAGGDFLAGGASITGAKFALLIAHAVGQDATRSAAELPQNLFLDNFHGIFGTAPVAFSASFFTGNNGANAWLPSSCTHRRDGVLTEDVGLGRTDYVFQANHSGTADAGVLEVLRFLGSDNYYWRGSFRAAAIFSSTAQPWDIANTAAWLKSKLLTGPIIAIAGDSNASGYNLTETQGISALLHEAYGRCISVPNISIPGQGMVSSISPLAKTMTADDPAKLALLRRTHSPAFVVGFVGTNDLANGVTAATLRAAVEAYAAAVQALGWKYIACTIPPRTLDTDGIAPWPAGKEAQRVAYNAGLVSDHAFAQGGLVDVDAINPTRQGDGLHLASAGAAAVATGASGVKAVIDPQI